MDTIDEEGSHSVTEEQKLVVGNGSNNQGIKEEAVVDGESKESVEGLHSFHSDGENDGKSEQLSILTLNHKNLIQSASLVRSRPKRNVAPTNFLRF